MVSKKIKIGNLAESRRKFAGNTNRFLDNDVPKYRFPSSMMEPRSAYQLIHDELNLDGNPGLNLATFFHS